MNVVQIENLSKSFGQVKALDGIDLNLRKGEILGFIGPNGAGKTTTLRILLGILKADAGKAFVFGRDAWQNSVDIHRDLVYVPGDVNLWPNLTGGEVIDLFIRLRKGRNKQYRDELIEKFDFDPTKKCRTYSKGNRQKVALVAAFASDAELFVLDEPTSGLDPLMESVFRECVTQAKNEGKSVLLSSHILSEVEKLCNRVSIIRQGKIIETGTLAELRHLTRTDVRVQTVQPLTNLENLPYLHQLVQDGPSATFSVDGEKLGDVISYLSRHEILNLECMPPTLEQLFMSHYAERSRK